MSVVALWSRSDHLLSLLAPIGVALNRRPSVIVDLDPLGPRYDARYTLADLVADGPTKAQLEPSRRGVSFLPNGGVDVASASEVIAAIVERWPNVVIRCDPHIEPPETAIAIVPLLPQPLVRPMGTRTVYQRLGFRVSPPPQTLVLPRPDAATLHAVAGLSEPPMRSKWLRSLGKLWSLA